MSSRLKKTLLLALAALLLAGVSPVQKALNHERDHLGLTRVEPLENAPPVLAFTTVALGGFRGLISNALWIRASDLQDDDKFFELSQLADWITKLEPHFVHVWLVQSWNMAYNISVKFKDFPDRWRWVKRGIELLRDDGLRFNPNEILIYRELAWFFQHKMGANLDDANMYYKRQWCEEMSMVLGKKTTNLDELIHPQTKDQQERRLLLLEKYKMDPELMKEDDDRYGPLEWRLPEAHAIYWASKGLKMAKEHPTKVKPEDLITLRRVIYQSVQLSFYRGLIINPFTEFDFGPNLAIIPHASAAYEQEADEEPNMRDHILSAHRNFLRDAVYFLYENNRMSDAEYWFKYLCQKYPNRNLIDGRPDSICGTVTLDEYAVACIQTDISETSRDRVKASIEGMLTRRYLSLVTGEDAHAAGYLGLARQIWLAYDKRIPQERKEAIGLPPLEDTDRVILRKMLDPERGLPPEARAILRTKLALPAEEKEPEKPQAAPSTNSPPPKISSK
jgi:hypothetical protein